MMDDCDEDKEKPRADREEVDRKRNFNPRAPVSILMDALHLFLHLII